MLHCQFLCLVLIALFFIEIALKLSYFCKKMQTFRALGASPPNPQNHPRLRISGYAPGCAFERRSPLEFREKRAPVLVKTFFWSSPELWEKKVFHFGRRPFFGLHLICSTEKNRGRGSSPPMLKIGQN